MRTAIRWNVLVELDDGCLPRYTPSTGKLRASDKPLYYLKNDVADPNLFRDRVFIVRLQVIEGVLYCLLSSKNEVCSFSDRPFPLIWTVKKGMMHGYQRSTALSPIIADYELHVFVHVLNAILEQI